MGSTHWRINSAVRDRGWSSSCRTLRSTRHDSFTFIIELLELNQDFANLFLSFIFLNRAFTHRADTLSIYKVACSRSSRVLTANTFPMLLEIWLNVLQSVKSRHFTRFLLRSCLWWNFSLNRSCLWFDLILRATPISILGWSTLLAICSFFFRSSVMGGVLTIDK